jgi:hypothetical protein
MRQMLTRPLLTCPYKFVCPSRVKGPDKITTVSGWRGSTCSGYTFSQHFFKGLQQRGVLYGAFISGRAWGGVGGSDNGQGRHATYSTGKCLTNLETLQVSRKIETRSGAPSGKETYD